MSLGVGLGVAAAAFGGLVDVASAQSETKLTSFDIALRDRLGTACATSGDVAVVGARGDDLQAGSAYVFELAGGIWVQTAKLIASDRAAGDRFGSAIAFAGDRVVVGSLMDDDRGADSGSAYVFERGPAGWAQTAKLTASDGLTRSYFGNYVAADGDRIVVGSWGHNGQRGAAYVFELDAGTGAWAQTAVLAARDAMPDDRFGDAVALSGDTVFVGAPGDDGAGTMSGAGYVFELSGGVWNETAKLVPPGLGQNDQFASSVSMSADTVVAGARENGIGGIGAAFVFERGTGTWTAMQKLTAGDPAFSDFFGHSVAIDHSTGNRIVVGAVGKNNTGASYVFDRSAAGFVQTAKLVASDAAGANSFGQDVSVAGRTVLVAAPGNLSDRGAAYAYRWPSPVDPGLSVIAADDPAISAFGGTTRVSVTPRDSAGRDLGVGFPVTLSATGGTLVGAVEEQNGVYSQVLAATSGVSGATVSAVVDGVQLFGTATVTFVPVDLAQSTVAVWPESIEVGQQATVTVTPKDGTGGNVGAGLDVAIGATAGQLLGSVTDNGDGTYSQVIDGTAAGTGDITATVGGLPLDEVATLSITDPATTYGSVMGLTADGTPIPYKSIQQAVRRANRDRVNRILVPPGDYPEMVSVSSRRHLSIEGLTSFGPVTVRGFRVNMCRDVTITNFEVVGRSRHHAGIQIGAFNRGVTLQNLLVHETGSCRDGITIGWLNADIAIESCMVEGSRGDGISVRSRYGATTIMRSIIQGNGRNGIQVSRDAQVKIVGNVISDNGNRGRRHHGDGYGILKDRSRRHADPERITLIGNVLAGNHGRVVPGRSDENLGNYDQMIDPTDAQAPY